MGLPVREVSVMSVVAVTIVLVTNCVIVAVAVDAALVVVVVVVPAFAALSDETNVSILSSTVQIFVPRRTVVCEMENVSVQVITIVSISRLVLFLLTWLCCV